MNAPELPARPAELAEIESRHRAIRTERLEVEAEIRGIQDATWLRQNRAGADVDAAVERLVAGESDPVPGLFVPERLPALQSRLGLLRAADSKLAGRVAEQRERHSRQIAKTLRPLHRRAVQRVHRALLELEAANSQEQAVRARIPGVPMTACDFPNVGRRGPGGGALDFWVKFARRQGFLEEDEPEADLPAAAY